MFFFLQSRLRNVPLFLQSPAPDTGPPSAPPPLSVRKRSGRLNRGHAVKCITRIRAGREFNCYFLMVFREMLSILAVSTDSWSITNHFTHCLAHSTDSHGLVNHRFRGFPEHIRCLSHVLLSFFIYTVAILYGVLLPLISSFCMTSPVFSF